MAEIDKLVEDFFMAPQQGVTTHEEWLLRLCAQLMEREATAVSLVESQARKAHGKKRVKGGCKRPTENSNASTEQSTEMRQT